jgi:pimeloyl-ACP methyl ester carboxylesterase
MHSATPDYGLIDRAGVAGAIFFPRPDHSRPPPGADDLSFEVADEIRLGARLYTRDRALPTMLYWHGNGEVAGDYDGFAPLYHEIGLNLLVIDFRGYGRSNGRPTFESLVNDGPVAAKLAHAYLDERGYAPRRYLMGRSLGSHPALEIAARAPDGLEGLIIESGAANLRRIAQRLAGGVDPGVAETLAEAHEAKIRSIRLPVLILHGEWDELVPLQTAELLHELLEGTDRKLVVIPGAGHNDIAWVGREQYFAEIADFTRSPDG